MINKRQILATIAAACLAAPIAVMADGDGTGIVGSPHDFTDNWSPEVKDASGSHGAVVTEIGTNGWNGRGEICRVCHIPHDNENADKLYEDGLLWNHQVSATSFTMYNKAFSDSIDGTVSSQPDGTAKLCLGCHDGTVALDAFDKYGAGNAGNKMGAIYGGGIGGFVMPNQVAGNLTGTHPISITYDPVADDNLHAKTDTMGMSGTIDDVLDAGKVQCSSCHDVHNQESVPGTHLLRVAQKAGSFTDPNAAAGAPAVTTVASGLCLTCHIK